MKNYIVLFVVSLSPKDVGKYRKFEKPKVSYFLEKTLFLSIICSKCKNEDEKIFKEAESIEILKILGLIENIFSWYN